MRLLPREFSRNACGEQAQLGLCGVSPQPEGFLLHESEICAVAKEPSPARPIGRAKVPAIHPMDERCISSVVPSSGSLRPSTPVSPAAARSEASTDRLGETAARLARGEW